MISCFNFPYIQYISNVYLIYKQTLLKFIDHPLLAFYPYWP